MKKIMVDGHEWIVEQPRPGRWLTTDSKGNRFRFVAPQEDHHDPECVSYPLDVDAEWEREALESVIKFRKGEYL